MRIAQNEEYREDVLRRGAQLEACGVIQALYEHLGLQPVWSEYLKHNALPSTMTDTVLSAIETASRLKAELEASGDEVRPTWYETGSAYDRRRMKQSHINEGAVANNDSVVAVTLLPGIDRRHSGSHWSVLVPAVVHISA
jgi:hypothetical protein